MERISANEIDDIASPVVLDLIAAFSLMEEGTFGLLSKAEKEGWTNERLINEIGAMLSTSSASDVLAPVNNRRISP